MVQGASDPDGDSLTFAWAFGDGGTATGQSVTHVYSATGTFNVFVRLNDGRGGEASTSRSLLVSQNRPPTTGSIAVSPTGVGLAAATNFTFIAQGISDPDGDPITYLWEFGDGAPNPPSAPSVTKTYDWAQTYAVRLIVNDGKNPNVVAGQTTVTVRGMAGNWDVSLIRNSSWPWLWVTNFTLTLTQQGNQIRGSAFWVDPCGRSWQTPYVYGSVSDPRQVTVGIESWSGNGTSNPCSAPPGDDSYFTGPADTALNSVSGSCQVICASFSMIRR
ncbi:MAG: PKD domain-containing protein [Acidobacteria bacterium]|nr:PKD domain-containing protein [Acidobacteriota bacterium]